MHRERSDSRLYFVGVNHFDPLGPEFLSESFTVIEQQNGHQPLFVAVEYAGATFEKLRLLRAHYRTELQVTFQSYPEEFLDRIAETLAYEPTVCTSFWSAVPVVWLLDGLPKHDSAVGQVNNGEDFVPLRIRSYCQFFNDAVLNGSMEAKELSQRLSAHLRRPEPNDWPDQSREDHMFAKLSQHGRVLSVHDYTVAVLGASHLKYDWESIYKKSEQLGFERYRRSIWEAGTSIS